MVAAVVAVGTAYFAWRAASTWRDALQNQRDDECVAASSELWSSMQRCISAVRGRRAKDIWPAYAKAWNHQARFRSTYKVARRYHEKNLEAYVPDKTDDLLTRLTAICDAVAQGQGPDEAQLNENATAIRGIVVHIQEQLGASS